MNDETHEQFRDRVLQMAAAGDGARTIALVLGVPQERVRGVLREARGEGKTKLETVKNVKDAVAGVPYAGKLAMVEEYLRYVQDKGRKAAHLYAKFHGIPVDHMRLVVAYGRYVMETPPQDLSLWIKHKRYDTDETKVRAAVERGLADAQAREAAACEQRRAEFDAFIKQFPPEPAPPPAPQTPKPPTPAEAAEQRRREFAAWLRSFPKGGDPSRGS